MTRQRLRTLAAAAAFLGATALVGSWAAGGANDVDSVRAATEAPPDFVLRPPMEAQGLQETLTRPLFSPDRRAMPAPEAADTGADVPPATRLLAVAVGPERSAAVLLLASGKTSVLMQGEAIDGWVLVHVSRDGVTLRSGQQEAALAIAGGRK